MSSLLQSISVKINQLNEAVGRAVAWLTALLMLIVCFDVVARKLFNSSWIWVMEMEWHLYALIFLLGAGYALKHNRHVRVDLFYEKFSDRDKALTNFWGHLLFLIPWCLLVIYFTFGYALESFRLNEGSPEPGGLPARFIIKFCISLGIFFLLLQAIAGLIDAGLVLFDKNTENKTNSDHR